MRRAVETLKILQSQLGHFGIYSQLNAVPLTSFLNLFIRYD